MRAHRGSEHGCWGIGSFLAVLGVYVTGASLFLGMLGGPQGWEVPGIGRLHG